MSENPFCLLWATIQAVQAMVLINHQMGSIGKSSESLHELIEQLLPYEHWPTAAARVSDD